MDALRALRFGDLPPVGNSICLAPRLPLPAFEGYRDLWLNSGTAALALAFLHARRMQPERNDPEVIVPAYACPDLVAAAVHAGVRPVVVDIQENDPGYDLKALQQSLGENTLAVVAVNFLGLTDRLDAIRRILPPDTALVEDNAQWHPEPDGALKGEYVIASFGRGKPASVLGGGLLLVRQDLPLDISWVKEQFSNTEGQAAPSMSRHRLKAMAYNLLRKPPAYFCINRSRLFSLGETRYRPLEGIANMSPACQTLVAANVQDYLMQDRWRELFYDELVADLPGLKIMDKQRRRRLLRYPLLCGDREQRDAVLNALERQGLGASVLYRRPLGEIPGVEEVLVIKEKVVNAHRFADRLLTLPLHSDVSLSHLKRIAATLRRHAGPQQFAVPKTFPPVVKPGEELR